MSEPQYVAEALAWCNERREERGKKPLKKLPKGHRMDPASCPCGKATGLDVYSTWYDDTSNEVRLGIPIPTAVTCFVRAFDDGQLPQYELAEE